nr:hypothetical protein CFP56_16581 [Quercus suber]
MEIRSSPQADAHVKIVVMFTCQRVRYQIEAAPKAAAEKTRGVSAASAGRTDKIVAKSPVLGRRHATTMAMLAS